MSSSLLIDEQKKEESKDEIDIYNEGIDNYNSEIDKENNTEFPDDEDSDIPPKGDPPKKPSNIDDDLGGSGSDKTKKGFIVLVVVGAILVGTVWGMYMTNTGFFDNGSGAIESYSQSQCEGVLMEGKAIVLRNGGDDNYNTWDNEEDRQKIIKLENEFIRHCTMDEEQILKHNLKECTKALINWHTFVDQLPSKDRGTWDKETILQDSEFKHEYEKYNCQAIDIEIRTTEAFKKHNEQYHEGEEP